MSRLAKDAASRLRLLPPKGARNPFCQIRAAGSAGTRLRQLYALKGSLSSDCRLAHRQGWQSRIAKRRSIPNASEIFRFGVKACRFMLSILRCWPARKSNASGPHLKKIKFLTVQVIPNIAFARRRHGPAWQWLLRIMFDTLIGRDDSHPASQGAIA